MKIFEAYRYNGEKWVNVDGALAFPFSFSRSLDEMLDEAYLTIYGSSISKFDRLEIWRIVIDESDGKADHELYYILADDSSEEYPVGSGRYKHSLYLLEPTKMLEGMYCQTLTFTNELGWSDAKQGYARADVYLEDLFNIDYHVTPQINNVHKSPDDSVEILAENVAYCISAYSSDWGVDLLNLGIEDEDEFYYITADGFTYDDGDTVSITSDTSIIYKLPIIFADPRDRDNKRVVAHVVVKYNIKSPNSYLSTKPYTIARMAMRCLEQAQPLKSGRAPLISLQGATYKGGVGGSVTFTPGSIAEKLDGIIGDEITLTQNNLREQLRAIGRLIHSEPRLNVIYNGVNKAPAFELTYDEYTSNEAADLSGKSYIHRQIDQSINDYCTEVRSYASNLVNANRYDSKSIQDPYTGKYKSLRSEDVNIRIEEATAFASTEFPIYRVRKVMFGILSDAVFDVFEGGTPIDITDFVLEQAAYNLKSDFGDQYPDSKSCFLYYTQGEKGIKGLNFKREQSTQYDGFRPYAISRIYEIKTGDNLESEINKHGFDRMVFQIEYIPIYAALFSHSNGIYNPYAMPYEKIYTQSENIVNVRNYGEHVKGIAARLGVPQESRTYLFKNYEDIPNVGQYALVRNNYGSYDEYGIISSNVELTPNCYKATLSMSPNFNKLSEYIGIDSHKRVYEVSEREAYERSILIKQKLVLTTDEYMTSDLAESLVFNKSTDLDFVLDSFNPLLTNPISVAAVKTDGAPEIFHLPVIASGFGNAIVFSFRFKDNYSAGVKSEYFNGGEVSGYWGVDVPYKDNRGRFKTMSFALLDEVFDDKATPYSLPESNIDSLTSSSYGWASIKSNDLYVDADSREAINVNVEIELLSGEPGLYIGSGFASSHPRVTTSRRKNARLYLFTGHQTMQAFQRDILSFLTVEEIESGVERGKDWLSLDISDCFLTDTTRGYERFIFTMPDIPDTVSSATWAVAVPPYIHEEVYSDSNGDAVKTKRGGDIIFCSNAVTPNQTFYIIPKN